MTALLTLLGGRATPPEPTTSPYLDRLLATSPLVVWALADLQGPVAPASVATPGDSPQFDGTYTDVALADVTGPDGVLPAPCFDGDFAYLAAGSAALGAGFGGSAGTVAAWGRVAGAETWVDYVPRNLIELAVDNNNRVILQKTGGFNTLQATYAAGAVTKSVSTACSATGWFHLALTWDAGAGTGGEVKAYLDGAQAGTTQTGLGTWAGTLDPARCFIGARNTWPMNAWAGWLAHVAVWTRALAPADVAALATA